MDRRCAAELCVIVRCDKVEKRLGWRERERMRQRDRANSVETAQQVFLLICKEVDKYSQTVTE